MTDTGKTIGTGTIPGPTKVVIPEVRTPRVNQSEGTRVKVPSEKPKVPVTKTGG